VDSDVSGIGGRFGRAPGPIPNAVGWDQLQRVKPAAEDAPDGGPRSTSGSSTPSVMAGSPSAFEPGGFESGAAEREASTPDVQTSDAPVPAAPTGTADRAATPTARHALTRSDETGPPATASVETASGDRRAATEPGPRGGSGRTPTPPRTAARPRAAGQPRIAEQSRAATQSRTTGSARAAKPGGKSAAAEPAAAPTKRGRPPKTGKDRRRAAKPPVLAEPAFSAPDAAPTSPASTGFTRRLLSMLPWPATTEPVGDLIRSHRSIHPGGDPNLLRRAYAIAEQMHRGQTRKSGDPYITHPLAVAQILADLGMDTITLVAALLHDTVEDTSYTLQALESEFGPEVALLVDGVTKFDKVFYGEAAEAETIRKLIVAAGRDVRVLVIKLADRLHNMRTLDARSPASRARIARATRDVLVPLCDRLGIQALKRDLEDCVLKSLSPSGYALVADYVKHRGSWLDYLGRVISEVEAELDRARVDATVSPRPRHLYSIWKDTVAGNYREPHDLPRIVIVVDGPDTDCYAALGAMHGRWRPVPGRFKDFIASPKNNLYRSLHTTVTGPESELLEVLIRTAPMHRDAEYGIVANFRYPQHAARAGMAGQEEQLAWLHRVLDWEGAAADPAQFLASLRCDLAESQIIVFTSTGRPVLLPAEATPVDLAYTLGHSIGDRCIAAKLNGRLVALSSELVNGDVVEIITRQGQRDEFDIDDRAPAPGPSSEWLQFVKTPQARLHISRWFADQEAPAVTIANKVRLGRLAVGLALRQCGRGLGADLPLIRLAGQLGFPDLETLLVAVADHKLSAAEVVDNLIASVDHTPR
jgi:guanosine-3',5'-bis(diphosphate) 3'-pyrophosphohydrolase